MEEQHTVELEQKRLGMLDEIQAKYSAGHILEVQALKDHNEHLKHELELTRTDNGRLAAESKEDREETVRWKQRTADLEHKLADLPQPQITKPFPQTPLAVATRHTFDSLSVAQRYLLKEIYEHPGTAIAFLGTTLNEMKFPLRLGLESADKLLRTNLVRRGHTKLDLEPNPDIKEIVERLLETEGLPSAEFVKQINAETSAALTQDHNLAFNQFNILVAESTNFLSVFDSGYDPARSIINVIAKNQSGKELWIWAPVWDNSTGDVESVSPPSSAVLVDGSGVGLAKNIWNGAGESARVGSGQHVVFTITVMPARGEGIPLRLNAKNTGAVLVPIKVEGGLRVERLMV